MSTNITNWETKRLGDLRIPIHLLMPDPERWGEISIELTGMVGNAANFRVTIVGLPEGFQILGSMVGEERDLHVNAIRLQGESSGNFYFEVLKPALEQSKGYLDATLIWDSTQHLVVKDGVISDGSKTRARLLAQLFELLPDVEWAIEVTEADTDQLERHLNAHPGLDNEEERVSIAKRRKWEEGAREFVRLFEQLKE